MSAYVYYAVNITVWYTVPNVTTPDAGSVTVSVNGTSTQPVNYSSASTGVSIAGQLAGYINAFGFVTASNNNTNVITIQSVETGSTTNYALSASSVSNYPQYFNPPSFTPGCNNNTNCPAGSSLSGGNDAVTQSGATLYSFSLGYGAGNSNVTFANDSANGNWVFTYDYLNRLSTSNQNNNQNACSYGYDQLGNRTSQTATAGSCGGNLSLSYSGHNNRMDGYSYDAVGNVLGDGLHTYAYDAENRLISVDGGVTASYIYDAQGRRVQKKTSTQVEYLYDVNGNIMTELSSTGSWNRGEIFANGQHLATYSNGTTGPTYFDHTDWLGTERDRSSMADTNCESITSLPFGDFQSTSGTCADASPLHFTGQQRDTESNLDYFRARYYSSQFGRFMSPDPTGIFLGNLNDPQSLNLYSYVRNNPLNLIDPTGLGGEGPPDPNDDADWGPFNYGDPYRATGGRNGPHASSLDFEACVKGNEANGESRKSAEADCKGSQKDVNKTWSQTSPCNASAQQVMSAVQNDMGQFADNRGYIFAANFPHRPLKMGLQYVIEPGLNAHTDSSNIFPAGMLVVTVTSQSANGWTFTTNPSQHYFDGTVSFSSTDAGNGNVTFSITANANYSNLVSAAFGPLIKAGENSTWNNMLNNVQAYCQFPTGN